MVVQQGRLQDQQRKIATETLLYAVRFGADKIFRPEKATGEITDDDMDAIIARGQKRTAELEARLASAEKGDLLDFKLDGGMDTQQWEGVDYSDIAIRQQLKNSGENPDAPFVLDTGKRERKKTTTMIYDMPETTRPSKKQRGAEEKSDNKGGDGKPGDATGKSGDDKTDGGSKVSKKSKGSRDKDSDGAPGEGDDQHVRTHSSRDDIKPLRLPMHLRLPKLEEWQFFEHKDRLLELQAKEEEKFAEMQSTQEKRFEFVRNPWKYYTLKILSDAETEEKERLFEEGFPRWTKQNYQQFLKASARHGRTAYEKISDEILAFAMNEVEAYSNAFWTKGMRFLTSAEWDRACRMVEKGERKLEEMEQLMKTTTRFVNLFQPEPRRNLVFRFASTSAGLPQFPGLPSRPDEEAILLSLLVEHGYGNWRIIRQKYREAPELRFDWFLRSLDTEGIQRRAEALMRAAEKELAELERRHQAYLAAEQAIAAARAGVERNPETGRPYSQPERVALMFEKMRNDHKKQADLRSELKAAKLHGSASSNRGGGATSPAQQQPIAANPASPAVITHKAPASTLQSEADPSSPAMVSTVVAPAAVNALPVAGPSISSEEPLPASPKEGPPTASLPSLSSGDALAVATSIPDSVTHLNQQPAAINPIKESTSPELALSITGPNHDGHMPERDEQPFDAIPEHVPTEGQNQQAREPGSFEFHAAGNDTDLSNLDRPETIAEFGATNNLGTTAVNDRKRPRLDEDDDRDEDLPVQLGVRLNVLSENSKLVARSFQWQTLPSVRPDLHRRNHDQRSVASCATMSGN